MNLEVLNSYFAGEDGAKKYFEVIMVDKNHPRVNVSLGRRRVFRGLTAAARKSRGLLR